MIYGRSLVFFFFFFRVENTLCYERKCDIYDFIYYSNTYINIYSFVCDTFCSSRRCHIHSCIWRCNCMCGIYSITYQTINQKKKKVKGWSFGSPFYFFAWLTPSFMRNWIIFLRRIGLYVDVLTIVLGMVLIYSVIVVGIVASVEKEKISSKRKETNKDK